MWSKKYIARESKELVLDLVPEEICFLEQFELCILALY